MYTPNPAGGARASHMSGRTGRGLALVREARRYHQPGWCPMEGAAAPRLVRELPPAMGRDACVYRMGERTAGKGTSFT